MAIEIIEESIKQLFYRQLYTSVISIMETYLSDAFINTVIDSKDNLERFYKTFKGFEKQNIPIANIFEFERKVEPYAKKAMLDVNYHNLPKVSKMYKDTLSINFSYFDEIYKYVLKRHDFVHRNGKDKDGNVVFLNSNMLIKLVKDIRMFVVEIDNQIPKR